MRHRLSLLICLVAAALAAWALTRPTVRPSAFVPVTIGPATGIPVSSSAIVDRRSQGMAHAASIVEVKDGRQAIWFAGSREGATDVGLLTARFNGARWSEPTRLTDAWLSGRELGRRVKTVGNNTVFRHPNGELWLVYVSVSIGGWAGSRLNLKRSSDDGLTWTPAKRLRVSPFFNLSNLVKQQPVTFTDGTVGLGVYHEFINKFPEFLLLDSKGDVVGKRRMGGAGALAIQPAIAVLTATEAVAFMRKSRRTLAGMRRTATADAGQTWAPVSSSGLPNPGGAVSVLTLERSKLLLAFNDDERTETDITLAISEDSGTSWRRIAVVARAVSKQYEVSYPYMIAGSDGFFDLIYTNTEDASIRHFRFNRAWIQEQFRSGTRSGG